MTRKSRRRVTRTHRRKAKQAIKHGPKAKPSHRAVGKPRRGGRKGLMVGPTR